jgi:ClpP class serine protease
VVWKDAFGVASAGGHASGGSEKVVSVIPVRGAMTKHNQVCGPAGTRTIAARLKEADMDPDVIGHVLVFETGGGSANSVPELSEAIIGCSKPTLAYVDGMMCSAGQFAGSYCREVMASRASDLIGSIGTMIVFEGRKAKSEENDEKIIHLRVYADGADEKNQEFESAINDFNFKLVKERILNPHNEQFIAQVKSNRPGVLEEHLHGRAYPAGEVLGSLVDSIGSFEEAVKRVVSLSGFKPERQGMASDSVNVQSQIIVSMKYPQIMSVLALDNESFVSEADGRRTFTKEEMEAIELALGIDHSGGLNAALTETQSNLDAANSVITEREATITEREGRIVQLEAENANLRQQPAGAPAAVLTDTARRISWFFPMLF